MSGKRNNVEFEEEATRRGVEAFDRRTFLKVMGAGLAAMGVSELGGCSKPQPVERIVPYVRMPEHVVPGVAAYYASAVPTRGFASGFGRGVIVESHEGRPTKMEGNALHPSSLGGTDIFMQAAVLQLYDPERSKTPVRGAETVGWGEVWREVREFVAARGGARRVRVGLLTGCVTSPSLVARIEELRGVFPGLRWFSEDALGGANERRGLAMAAGKRVMPVLDLTKAARVVSLDGHFLGEGAGAVRYAREYAGLRRNELAERMGRLYVAECGSTFTGVMADHRIGVGAGMMARIAGEMLGRVMGKAAGNDFPAEVRAWMAAACDDLLSHRGDAVVVAGAYQPAEVHAAAYAINGLIGAVGKGVDYLEPVEILPAGAEEDFSLAALVRAMDAGELDMVLMLDVNPAYAAAGDLRFGEVLKSFSADGNRRAIHAGGYVDETAGVSGIHLPLSHGLEAWGDLRGHEGTASIVQPLIEPLWNTQSAGQVLASLTQAGRGDAEDALKDDYELVRDYWMKAWGGSDERRWRESLRDGVVAATQGARANRLAGGDAGKILAALAAIPGAATDAMEIFFRPDPTVGDGSYANHPWLQELPKPLTRTTWGNLAILGPETARRLGIEQRADVSRRRTAMVRVEAGWSGEAVELPAWVMAGHPENAVTLHLGGGRSGGSVAEGVGVNVNPLRQMSAAWNTAIPFSAIARIERTAEVACVQAVESMDGRDVCRVRDVAEVGEKMKTPKLAHLSLYKKYEYTGYKWGMVVDLSTCIGCNACVVACQAENNIPSVGREQVYVGREMHWMRIDTYREESGGRHLFMPMLCQHCENAPCEVVCPVEATTHSEEGINEMTYNRCVGTRYCSNNCPYKVRRFNFLHFTAARADDDTGDVETLQRNPNVTVRSRGVMEKCTYCIQRINRARIDAKRTWAQSVQSPLVPAPEMRKSAAGAEELPRLTVVTACQQACPTEAITFGDLNDAESAVGALKRSGLNYAALEETNTEPRTSYLERVMNPHPGLGGVG